MTTPSPLLKMLADHVVSTDWSRAIGRPVDEPEVRGAKLADQIIREHGEEAADLLLSIPGVRDALLGTLKEILPPRINGEDGEQA